MGLLSYSFVTVTLVADLGLPWNFYQLGIQAPAQSAMFEVSWCVGLYVTILLLEFLPVPLEHMGLGKAMATWRRWQGAYVAFALAVFVYLLSRSVGYAAVALVVFGFLAWAFRDQGKHHDKCSTLCPPARRKQGQRSACAVRPGVVIPVATHERQPDRCTRLGGAAATYRRLCVMRDQTETPKGSCQAQGGRYEGCLVR